MLGLDPISNVATLVGSIIDKIFPDKNVAIQAKATLETLAQTGKLEELKILAGLTQGQLDINKVEAAHSGVFVAGWRPFIGWVCGSALAYNYILMPFLVWAFSTFGVITSMPALDMGELMTLLLGILGLGAMRTYEKKNILDAGSGK